MEIANKIRLKFCRRPTRGRKIVRLPTEPGKKKIAGAATCFL
jgi:hypothetical protein